MLAQARALNPRGRTADDAAVVSRLEKLFGVILAQARQDPAFARALEKAMAGSTPTPPPPPRHRPAVLDPFQIYEQGWESMLRQRLGRLDDDQLHDVIHEYELDRRGNTAGQKDADKLRDWIVKAVLERQKKL